MFLSIRFLGYACRLLLFSIALFGLAGLGVNAIAQTAPQLLPYTVRLIAGGGTVAYSETSTTPATYGPACSTGKTSSGNTPTDKYGDGCLATEIELTGPRNAIADKTGAIFISDYTNGLIRRVDPVTGIITLVAGGAASSAQCGANPDAKGDGCLANQVLLDEPTGLAFDANGNLYFAELGNNDVREIAATSGLITTTGVISLVAGSPNLSADGFEVDNTAGTGGAFGSVTASTSSLLDYPYGIAFDAAGNLYIADTDNEAVEVVNLTAVSENFILNGVSTSVPAGTIAKLVGYGAYEKKSTSGECPNGPYVSSTNRGGCYYGAYTNSAQADSSLLDAPYAVALDPAGNLYIADEYENSVAEVTASTGILTGYAGAYPLSDDGAKQAQTERAQAGTFTIGTDYGLVADANSNLYVTDALNGYVWRIDGATQSMYVVAGGAATATTAGSPCASGSSFTAIDTYGDGCPAYLATFGKSGTYYASTGIFGITVDAYADLFVGDTGTNLVREVASGTQFGNIGATQTDYIDIHFAAGDGPLSSGAFTITTGATIFSIGTPTYTMNSDNTVDYVLPITAVPPATGPFTGILTVKSNLVSGGTSFPLSGNFVQSPVTRTVVSSTGAAGCTGTTYATATPVTLNATLTANGPSAPTGNIIFYSNGTALAPTTGVAVTNLGTAGAPLYGATLAYAFPTAGSDSITATYVPTTGSYFTGSTSASSTITISVPTFTTVVNSYQQSTVAPGQTALYSFNIAQTAYTGTISFACTGLPENASCSFSPASVAAAGCTTGSTVALSVLTQQGTTVQPSGFGGTGGGPWQLLSVLGGFGLALMIGLRRRRIPMRHGQLWMALALLLAASGIVACGKGVGTQITPPTPAFNGSITVTATGSDSTTTNFTVPLVVN